MYGRPPRFPHGGGGRESALPAQPPPQHQLLGGNFKPNNFLQNPNDLLYQQNPNLHFPNTLLRNHFQSFPQPQPTRPNGNEALERIDREVVKARRDILASGDNVSAWKVSQAVCLALKVDSWESLGFRMQQVPSLHSLMVTEGKINAFIHCFVGVRRITTLYDLELAICDNEGIEQFEELELGPLVRHPLTIHYFSVSSDVEEVFRIRSEEIIFCLHEFMDTHQGKEVKIDELLDFIAEKRSLTGREKLNVRIQNLGRHITQIRKIVQSENTAIKKYVDGLEEKFGIKIRKPPFLSSQKELLDGHFSNISQGIKSFSGSSANFCGKHIRFSSISDKDESSDTDPEDNQCKNGTQSHSNLADTFQNSKSSDRVSSCPYLSVDEEMIEKSDTVIDRRHITEIQKIVQSENTTTKKYVDGLKEKFGIKIRKHPLSSSQKKKLDDLFSNTSQRIKSFSGSSVNFCGKHIRFPSSSDDEESSHTDHEDNQCKNGTQKHSNLTSQNPKSSDRVSSCPYPSEAEEMIRLGLKPDVYDNPGESSANRKYGMNQEPSKRKRKRDYSTRGSISIPHKLPKGDMDETNLHKGDTKRESCFKDTNDFAVFSESTRMFIQTWKEACLHNHVDEVLDRMLNFYGMKKKKKKLHALFSSHPFAGLLDIAVKSIKCGMWDSMYDTFQTSGHQGVENGLPEYNTNHISIEIESSHKDTPIAAKKLPKREPGVSIDEIIKKVTLYFEPDNDVFSHANPTREKKLLFLRKLCRCESWLIEKFSVEEFVCFGYGDFMTFMERHLHLLPHVIQKLMIGETSENLPFEASMLQLQLDVLLSQASTIAWENEKISKQKILELLRRQFPSFCFKSVESNVLMDFRDMIKGNEGNAIPKCVLFSATLLKEPGIGDSTILDEKIFLDSSGFEFDIEHKAGSLGPVTSKDAIQVLLMAPMLTDLDSWSHWDLIYAPSLGPLMLWLLNEVNLKEFFCLITKSGKIIRLDHSATTDSFLEVLLKGSSFETAVKVLSLLALYGGERNVPLSLLKCYANKAFHVLVQNSVEKELSNYQHSIVHEDLLTKQVMFKEKVSGNLSHELYRDRNRVDKGVVSASRLILDCLGYLPTEFCSFAANVLLSGFQSSFKDAPSAILSECKQVEQRIMLHDIGFSLGIMEWINDYHTFRSAMFTNLLFSLNPSCSKLASYDHSRGAEFFQGALKECPSSGGGVVGPIEAVHSGTFKVNVSKQSLSEVSARASSDDSTRCSSRLYSLNPTRIIESIRQDEFGLDPSLSTSESKMLKKQHARLGRALHCLSHELYSQDSHFLLELVQNADDNIYPQNVEPTLVFVLQEKGIVVLNNEIGFSAENIRALCDIGNSTKKGHGAGYIGKKGIGFKSVFRVTDAPEIHSNGFHVKFDITKGQIGFVLPTEVPPCDIDLYSRMVTTDTDEMNRNSWRTCIVLPFKETSSANFTMSNIISMFSDLHPSLLLFLHRLQCIKFRDMLCDSLIVMKKEALMDGIIQVSLGKEKMYWFVVSQKLQADSIRPDVHSTEISIAFTLKETGDGGYIPHLNQQPVFAFLPLRTYGLKFILQGDFVLPSSREEVDGDSPWNQWLLSEFPGLFISAERAFCDLPCFRRSPGKAVTAFMSFVPLVGEVQGFFSCLPRMIISKLRVSNCLLLEGDNNEWVPPCKVLRNWNEEARALLPGRLLHEHLGLGFLNKDIVLPDSLARALGIEDYGPKTLLNIISSLSHSESGLKVVGLGWLSAWINAIYLMSLNSGTESDLIINLRKIPFIPLSDGKHGSVDRDTIWLHSGITGVDSEYDLEAFPKLYAKLITVSHELFSAAATAEKSCMDKTIVENVTRMLLKVGVQRSSAHEIVKVHILPAISDTRNTLGSGDLLTEYLSFVMFHVQSGCRDCYVEREWIMEHLRSKALILTNYGYKQLNEVPIHFNQEYGNQIAVNKLLNGIDLRWHEVDNTYMRHPITKSLRDGMLKWRNFFRELGVTDFVQIVQSEKCVRDISYDVLSDMMEDRDMVSLGSVAKDWESPELVHLLSHLSARGDHEKCKYLLEILDTYWDEFFSDKVTGYCNISSGKGKPFKSSLVSILQNVRWMVSIMDNDFHCPKDLFHDCEAVRSILGVAAPYVVPKVKNQKLIVDLGLKSRVRLDDILTVIKSWRRTEKPIKASVSQMLKLYAFIWNEMTSSKQKIAEELSSGPFIFVPFLPAPSPEHAVTGSLLSPKEVYWHDTIGSLDQMKLMHPKSVSDMTHLSFSKMLRNVYPTLHDFFVNECGVEEIPSFRSYLQILLQLSTIALPSQAARTVFHVFSYWADGLISGSLSNDDVEHLRVSLLKKECAVLPTEKDKWASLHPSFGLICWSDDEKLRKEFKHQDSIALLYFGDLLDYEKEMLQTKAATLFRRLGIPALSGVVCRDAIYYGPTDSSFKASLVNWALPYAQRYIYQVHPNKYLQLKKSGFENLRHLQIVVVEKLFYRNVVKRCEVASKKRFECSCLLQGNILYATCNSDSHSIFMELSHLLFGEAPDLHLANFLHMITTMVEARSTEEQTEFFILNSQKVPKLPVEEPVWCLSLPENSESLMIDSVSTPIDESNVLKSKRSGIKSNWPPVDWRTAPGFKFAQANGSKMQASSSLQIREANDATEMNVQSDHKAQAEMNANWTFEDGQASTSPALCFQDTGICEDRSDHSGNMAAFCMDPVFDSVDLVTASDGPNYSLSTSTVRNHLSLGTSNAQTLLTGRLGEFVAFKYFVGKVGETSVKWVNEANETGLPYDLIIGSKKRSREFIEVKATKSGRKNWFDVSAREWQFAAEKGESFSIAHVVLLDNNTAKVTIYKNPIKLCQLGKLRLALLIPKQ